MSSDTKPAWWPSDEQKLRAELTTKTPAEIDGLLFPILDKVGGKEMNVRSAQDRLGGVPRYKGAHVWPLSDRERSGLEEMVARYAAEIEVLDAEALPFEREFERREGWTRYIVVPGGHLHKRGCHTLTPGRTMVGQVAEASGLDEEAVVGKYDEQACTHCFPNAPVAEKKTPEQEGYCPGSGALPDASRRFSGGRYGGCPSCGKVVSITTRGILRKHS